MTKYGMIALVAIVLCVLALIALVVNALRSDVLALMALIVLIVLPMAGCAIGMFWLMARTSSTQPRPRPRNDEAVDTSWRELPQGYYPPQAALPAPASLPRRVNVPVVTRNGTASREQVVLSTSTEAGELTCPVALLEVAAQLLASGKEPTRANFNAAGVMSSSEISACVDFLRLHGWIKPIPANSQNSPARWVGGADANALQEFVSTWST